MQQINKDFIEDFDDEVAAVVDALPVLVPLTTIDATGEPALVWDENDELVLIEVSL